MNICHKIINFISKLVGTLNYQKRKKEKMRDIEREKYGKQRVREKGREGRKEENERLEE